MTGVLFGEESLAPEENEDAYTTEPVYTDYDKVLTVKPAGSALPSAGVEYTDIPVLLRLSTEIPGFDYADFKRSGKDMLILDEESNVLPYEIQVWNEEGESLVWVKTLRYSAVTCLSVYYGDKENRRNAANDPKQVWSAYSGVWHLDELDNENTLPDSSPNGYNGKTNNVSRILEGGVLGNYAHCIDKQTESGQAGLYFDGTENIAHGGKLTLSAWVKRYQLNSCWDHLFYSKKGSSEWGGFASEFYANNSAWGEITLIGGGANGDSVRSKHGFQEVDKWYYIVVTYDGREAFYYNNGVLLGGGTMLNQPMWSNGQRFSLGNANDLEGTPWDGAFDEFRVSVGAMSPGRVALEYALMQEGAMAMTVGDNDGVRLELGDVSFTSNGDGTYKVSAEIVSGSASSVKVVFSNGTEFDLAPDGATAPWSVSEVLVSNVESDLSFSAKIYAESVLGEVMCASIDDYFYSGTVSVSATVPLSREEDLTPGEFTFSRAEGEASTSCPLIINYAIGGTAVAGKDYESLSGSVTIPAGESSAKVSLVPKHSPFTDNDVFVSIAVATGDYVVSQSSATLKIENSRNAVITRYANSLPITVAEGEFSGGPLVDFPLLVRLTPSEGGFSYDDFQRDDYEDIAFIDETGKVLSYEVQKFDPNGTSFFWVKVPSFSASSVIYACYGGLESGRTDPGNVWSGYTGVWHMDETEEGQFAMRDATSNELHGTYGAQTLSVAGVIGSARKMALESGNTSTEVRAIVPVKDAMNVDNQYLHASMWVRLCGNTGWSYLITRKEKDDSKIWGLQFDDTNKNFRFWGDEGTSTGMSWGSIDGAEEYSNGFPKNTWVKLDMIYLGSTYYLYVNGVRTSEATGKNWSNGKGVSEPSLSIGGPAGEGVWGTFNGEMDEVRITSSFTPSADWVAAAYANETDPLFLSLGAPIKFDSNAPAVGCASYTTVGKEQMIAIPLDAGEGRLYMVLRDSLGNVTTNAVTDGIVSSGTYYYPVSSLPVNTYFEIGTYAVGVDSKTDFRKFSITVRNTKEEKIVYKVTGYTGENSVADFPALIRLSEGIAGFSYRKLVDEGATFSDIHFQDVNGNELPFELDVWNPQGESQFWVKMPSLSKDAKIVMVYGVEYSPSITLDKLRSEVWSGQTGVWHMHYNANSSERCGNSAAENIDTLRTWNNQSVTIAEGIVGESRRVSSGGYKGGGENAVVVSNNDILDVGDNFTISLWIKYPKDQKPGWDRIISRKKDYNSTDGWEITLSQDYPNNLDVRGSNQRSTGAGFFPSESPVNDGEWHHVTAVFNGKSLSLYHNGELRVDGEDVIDAATNNDCDLSFGNNADKDEIPFKGWLDEIRLATGALSADRITADYETVAKRDFFTARPYCKMGMILLVR